MSDAVVCCVASRSSAYLSHHTLPLIDTFTCAVLAAVRLSPFNEDSIAGYGSRVGTVFVFANGPGVNTG